MVNFFGLPRRARARRERNDAIYFPTGFFFQPCYNGPQDQMTRGTSYENRRNRPGPARKGAADPAGGLRPGGLSGRRVRSGGPRAPGGGVPGRLPAGELRSDGESTTFRTVAGEELRTLRIGFKTENEARALSDLCKRMIADIEAGRFDEREYGSMDR